MGHFCRGKQHLPDETEKLKEFPKFLQMVFSIRSLEFYSEKLINTCSNRAWKIPHCALPGLSVSGFPGLSQIIYVSDCALETRNP